MRIGLEFAGEEGGGQSLSITASIRSSLSALRSGSPPLAHHVTPASDHRAVSMERDVRLARLPQPAPFAVRRHRSATLLRRSSRAAASVANGTDRLVWFTVRVLRIDLDLVTG